MNMVSKKLFLLIFSFVIVFSTLDCGIYKFPFKKKDRKVESFTAVKLEEIVRERVDVLENRGIDTILTFYNSISFPPGGNYPRDYIIYLSGKKWGHVEYFYIKGMTIWAAPKRRFYNADSVFNYFFTNRLDTVVTNPMADFRMTHPGHFEIYLYTNGIKYYFDVFKEQFLSDSIHPKVRFPLYLTKKLRQEGL